MPDETEITPAPSQEIPKDIPLHYVPVLSTNLKAVAFMDAEGNNIIPGAQEEGYLHVLFQSGTCYRYANVERQHFHGLMSAESVGKYFNAQIKANPKAYPGEEIPAPPPAPTV